MRRISDDQSMEQPRRAPRGLPAWLPRWSRGPLLVASGALLMLGAVVLYRALFPPPRIPTPRDVRALVERTLQEREPDPSVASRAYDVIRPSVVFIQCQGPEEDETGVSVGSGVVFDGLTGDILTCLHVVRGAAAIRVVFSDGSDSGALVITRMPENDLAVIRPFVIPDDLVPATLAGSGALRPGDEVVAVGSPFGIADSASFGVVSGLGRSFQMREEGINLSGLIQFDAAVNPGNSGGPLVDRNGEVVGIVSAILNPTEQEFFVGIGFAVTLESAGGALGAPLL